MTSSLIVTISFLLLFELSICQESGHDFIYVEPFQHECGIRPMESSSNRIGVGSGLDGRIVGGRETWFGEVPFQVMINESRIFGLLNNRKCGGVLITWNWVLTAAHCQNGWFGSLEVVLGERDIKSTKQRPDSTKIVVPVKQIVVHPNYNKYTFENDIALLELEESVEFNGNVQPICLPSADEDFVGEMATVSGWGRTKTGKKELPYKLLMTQVPIMANDKCEEMFHKTPHKWKKIPKSSLCAGYEKGGKDSCTGDSGGPLMVKRNNRWVLVGIVSNGIKCAQPNLPGIYTRVSHFVSWIYQTVLFG